MKANLSAIIRLNALIHKDFGGANTPLAFDFFNILLISIKLFVFYILKI